VYFIQQTSFFEKPAGRRDLLKKLIKSRPSAELRGEIPWLIGNVKELDDNGLYFRMGKSTQETRQVFDESGFHDEPFSVAPYTHALIDVELEVCAIARNTRLSPHTDSVARNLARILKEKASAMFPRSSIDFEIAAIHDPKEFIEHLRSAYSILSYRVEFSRPNPLDVDEDFVKPMERLLKAATAKKGTTEIKGENLDEDTLESITRSAVATGNEARAKLRMTSDAKKPIVKSTRTNPLLLSAEEELSEDQMADLLDQTRAKYLDIRGREKKSK
jgi:hypothetical protein